MSIERAVESTIKPFLYLIRKPRNNQKQSGNSIVGHPVLTTPAQLQLHKTDAVTGKYYSTSKGSFQNSNMVKIQFTHVILDVTLACDDGQSSSAHRVIILASSFLFSQQF